MSFFQAKSGSRPLVRMCTRPADGPTCVTGVTSPFRPVTAREDGVVLFRSGRIGARSLTARISLFSLTAGDYRSEWEVNGILFGPARVRLGGLAKPLAAPELSDEPSMAQSKPTVSNGAGVRKSRRCVSRRSVRGHFSSAFSSSPVEIASSFPSKEGRIYGQGLCGPSGGSVTTIGRLQ